MIDWLEIQFWGVAKWLIRRGWGASCTIPDYNEFPLHPRGVNDKGRCGSCRAKEVVEWIDDHIELIKT